MTIKYFYILYVIFHILDMQCVMLYTHFPSHIHMFSAMAYLDVCTFKKSLMIEI